MQKGTSALPPVATAKADIWPAGQVGRTWLRYCTPRYARYSGPRVENFVCSSTPSANYRERYSETASASIALEQQLGAGFRKVGFDLPTNLPTMYSVFSRSSPCSGGRGMSAFTVAFGGKADIPYALHMSASVYAPLGNSVVPKVCPKIAPSDAGLTG